MNKINFLLLSFIFLSNRLIKPSLSTDSIHESKKIDEIINECSICHCEMELSDEFKVNPCHHKFHLECMKHWANEEVKKGVLTCPLCRRKVTNNIFFEVESYKAFNGTLHELNSLSPSQIKNIDRILLSDKNIQNLSDTTFRKFSNVGLIDLSNNLLKTLPEGIFSNLKKLHIVNLSCNRLIDLPIAIFDSLPNLEMINLEDNPNLHIKDGTFSEFYEKRDLILTDIPLSEESFEREFTDIDDTDD